MKTAVVEQTAGFDPATEAQRLRALYEQAIVELRGILDRPGEEPVWLPQAVLDDVLARAETRASIAPRRPVEAAVAEGARRFLREAVATWVRHEVSRQTRSTAARAAARIRKRAQAGAEGGR